MCVRSCSAANREHAHAKSALTNRPVAIVVRKEAHLAKNPEIESPDVVSQDPEFLRFIAEHDSTPIPSGGAIPGGHRGPYSPTKQEIVEGMKFAARALARAQRVRLDIAIESVTTVFPQQNEVQ